MPHLIRDVAEGVWKNSLLSKVIRLETGEEPERFFDLEDEKIPLGISDGAGSGGSRHGNSAVEVVPTLKENLLLMPYFWKRGILNRF